MNKNDHESPDPEDLFNDTRMSFGDHIEDLRMHLFRALKGFAVGMLISLFFLGQYVMEIIVAPVEQQLNRFHDKMQKKDLDKKIAELEIQPELAPPPAALMLSFDRQALRVAVLGEAAAGAVTPLRDQADDGKIRLKVLIPNDPQSTRELLPLLTWATRKRVTVLSITEAFFVYIKVSLLTGLVLSSPWVFYHIWAFIAAGLYPHERKIVNVYLPFSVGLFLAGVFLCQFVVMPKVIEVMLGFSEWLGFSADIRLEEWLSFALLMPLVFGIGFQTPLVMMFLHTVNIVSIKGFRDARRMSWFLMAAFAAIVMPTIDAQSMLLLWVPMCCLYEIGILLCVWRGESDSLLGDSDDGEGTELVEV